MKLMAFVLGFFLVGTLHAGELTIVTINVWSGLNYKGTFEMGEYESKTIREARYRILVNQLISLKPDIVTIQEANKLPRYAKRLADDLEMDMVYSVGLGGIKLGYLGIPINLREGIAILAKPDLGLSKVARIELSSGKGIITNFFTFHFAESNQATVGKISLSNCDCYIINVHVHAGFDKGHDLLKQIDLRYTPGTYTEVDQNEALTAINTSICRRKEEIQRLLDWIETVLPSGAPVILLGDFNASPDQEEISLVRESGFIDTVAEANGVQTPGFSWDPLCNLNIRKHYPSSPPDADVSLIQRLIEEERQNPRQVDYIFIRSGRVKVKIIESIVVLNKVEKGLHPSDHFGMFTKVHWKSK